ncbi:MULTISPECIES: STAS domain-containing protein [Thermaerobacter]|uniref:Anti-sigma factor antagonist n=1 Tax=Thermaerobacter subterraneus DSM 13965 TaxID=867903 RepID=K6PZ59_9FIRM|nr:MULTISPECIES: anti-sigma factor antagonist [Thermaerobacter]EKP93859.1 anti-anti-sigma regulatory factor, SpoIIAA [Thermaerobacter subterraneus DSM 13965]QIA27081.1 anti-sigma factor antagonist [Thermaerobacter sp. PB12/4term]
MQVQLDWTGRTLVARLAGDFDEHGAEVFRLEIERAVRRRAYDHLVVNLQKVHFIDSSGLGALLGRYRRAREDGARVSMVSAPPHVRAVLQMAGILQWIPLYDDEPTALGAGRGVVQG